MYVRSLSVAFEVGLTVGLLFLLVDTVRLMGRICRRGAAAHDEQASKTKALEKADANLQRVVRAVGAKPIGAVTYDLCVGRYRFRVAPTSVEQHLGGIQYSCTCVTFRTHMPYPERIAALLLYLKNDPDIFDLWHRQDGFYWGSRSADQGLGPYGIDYAGQPHE